MTDYEAPVRDTMFVLTECLDPEPLAAGGIETETLGAILEAAAELARRRLAPLDPVGDREGCRLAEGKVTTPAGFREAFAEMRAGGWTAIDCAPEDGGQGLPYWLYTAVNEFFVSASMTFNMFQGLTHGAYSAIRRHGSAEQKAIYQPRLAACDWTGTMNLTEPQAGTDLGLIRTLASPEADGSWRISGEKIFISSGEHDLAENIVHLVLARTPDAPEGTRGLSLFIVPKFLPDSQGHPGTRNALHCARLERKMGIHGNPTCEMRYEGATGWLLGERHQGMAGMFTMMNEARLGVALQGYAIAETARQTAARYAAERLQGRAPGAVGAGPQPIAEHPDIRRILTEARAFTEGARALALWVATLIDTAKGGGEGAETAEALASLLTPVLKGFLTDRGFATCVEAQQVLGGHGYIEDNGMAQHVRDARIAMIYEGANGIQALDLVGRKLAQDGGKAMMGFLALVKAEATAPGAPEPLTRDFHAPLSAAAADLEAAALHFAATGLSAPRAVLCGATDSLHLFGHVAIGLMWSRMAAAALRMQHEGRGDAEFLSAKLATGRVWMRRCLPATALHLARIRDGAEPVLAAPVSAL